MISKLYKTLENHKIWLWGFIFFNMMYSLFLWIVNSVVFEEMIFTILLGSVLLFIIILTLVHDKELKKTRELLDIIQNNDKKDLELYNMNLFSKREIELIEQIDNRLTEKENNIKICEANLKDYEEYIQKWSHEIKTPLSLMTLVLDNRKDELDKITYKKLEYSRIDMYEHIEKMLYYSKIKADNKDYEFKTLNLYEICEDIKSEYAGYVDGTNTVIINESEIVNVFSDEKSIKFIMRQVVGNSIKYKDTKKADSYIKFKTSENEDYITLIIEDNGIGVEPYNIAYIFDKGFTGKVNRQSTGMGLYLCKVISDNINIHIRAKNNKSNFQIKLYFPKVK